MIFKISIRYSRSSRRLFEKFSINTLIFTPNSTLTPNVSGFSYNTRWKHQITSSSGMSSGMKWVRKICPWRVSIKVNFQHSCFGWYISFLWCKVFLHTPDFWKGIFFNPSTQKKAYANANPSFSSFYLKLKN